MGKVRAVKELRISQDQMGDENERKKYYHDDIHHRTFHKSVAWASER